MSKLGISLAMKKERNVAMSFKLLQILCMLTCMLLCMITLFNHGKSFRNIYKYTLNVGYTNAN